MQTTSENIGQKAALPSGRGKDYLGAAGADPNFVEMAELHVMLFSSLKRYLQGELEGSHADFVDHAGKCELSKWVEGEGEACFGHLKSFIRLRETHRQFHVDVDAVLEKLQGGSWIAAERISKFDLSQSLRRLLMAMTELNEVMRGQQVMAEAN